MEIKGAGGTPGGVGLFLGGLAMMVVGGYLLLQQVQVHSGFWHWFGPNTFGLTLIPLLVGIGFLFFDGKSVAGWLLTGAGALIIVAGIIANLQIWFTPTSLYNTLVMLGPPRGRRRPRGAVAEGEAGGEGLRPGPRRRPPTDRVPYAGSRMSLPRSSMTFRPFSLSNGAA